MRTIIITVFLLLILCLAPSCVQVLSDTQYRVECSIDNTLGTDSVTLFFLENNYNHVYRVKTVGLDSATSTFYFEGQIEEPRVAYLKFGNDSVSSFMFVLEPGETYITIGPDKVVLCGGDQCHEYMTYLKQRESILAYRKRLYNEYLHFIGSDSTVNIATEQNFIMRDSLLCDSLDCITVDAINQGNAASRIIFDRFASDLAPDALRRVVAKW